MSTEKDNIVVLIDGFNFYHAICAHMSKVNYPKSLKWLDYDSLMRNVILKDKPYNKLKINFYTAINTYKYDEYGNPHKSIQNHKIYTNALKTKNIEVIEGKFKFRDEKLNSYVVCKKCNHEQFVHGFSINFKTPVKCCKCSNIISSTDMKYIKKVEEKKTDVKIAVDLINFARDGKYNKIFLFSTDSDFIPAAEYIQNNCPNTRLIVVAPSDKKIKLTYSSKNKRLENKAEFMYNTSEFQQLGVFVLRLKLSKLINCLFEDEIKLPNKKILRNPWRIS